VAGFQIPGPLCGTHPDAIDNGTTSLWRMPAPGPVCEVPKKKERQTHRMSVVGGFPAADLSLGTEGVALLQSVEELRLKPYDDQTGKDATAWSQGATIGYGHLIDKDEWDRYKGGMTEAEADALFMRDLAPFEDAVGSSVTIGLQQYEFDALVILAFNIGVAAIKGSSVVKMVNNPAAPTGYASLEAAWKAWNKSQGQVMKGLDNRRQCEWRIYTTATYERW
jgi:GH24 family phage-related lysozyme (muramidase)